MDGFTTILIIFNILISFFSTIEMLYKMINHEKKYNSMNKEFLRSLKILEDKINSSEFQIVLKNNSYDIKTKMYNEKIFKKSKNRFMLYLIMNESCKFFSNIYNDKKIYCNIRINKNNDFYTIAHFRCHDTISIKDRLYYTNKNTDLMNIATNNYNKFVIANVDDFKGSNIFMIQNYELKNRSKAIISISLKDKSDLIGVYTIYFSKPLDDKIKLANLELSISTLKNKITDLIKEYIELNNGEYESPENILIENKIIN